MLTAGKFDSLGVKIGDRVRCICRYRDKEYAKIATIISIERKTVDDQGCDCYALSVKYENSHTIRGRFSTRFELAVKPKPLNLLGKEIEI